MDQTQRPSNVTTIQEREQQLRARSAARAAIAQLGGHFCGFVGVRKREYGGAHAFMVDEPMMHELDPRHDVYNHSPDGFEWGYGGSGPSQLALAICCNMVGRDRAQRIYHDFKQHFVAKLDVDTWYLRREDAMAIIELIEQEQLDTSNRAIDLMNVLQRSLATGKAVRS